MSELKSYLETLSLSTHDEAIRTIGPSFLEKKRNAFESNTVAEDETYLNFKSLNSFVAGVSPQRQQDVLNSLLLAQRAAQKAFPEEHQILEWYEKYFEVLTKIGWVFENKGFTNYQSTGNKFEVDSAILDIVGAAIASATGVGTAAAALILKKSIEAIKGLADSDSRIVAFEKNVHNQSKGNFQIGIATEENEAVSIITSAFILETTEEVKRILFFKSNKNNAVFKFNIVKATINNDVYSEVRNAIKTKLVADINNYISDLDI